VRDLRDAGPVVHRRDAEGGEPGHVGPAEFGPRRAADRRDELGRGRLPEPGPGAVRDVKHLHRPGGEQRPDEVRRLLAGKVRREPVVDRDRALVGDDVSRHAAPDADGVQALVVAQAVDFRLAGRVPAQHVEDGGGVVNGVAAHPRPRGVRSLAGHGDLGPQRALAAALDLGRTRLHQHGEVAGQELRAVAAQPQQPVAVGRDLLAVVEDVRDVPAGRGEAGGQPELHRHPRFHVRGPAAVEAGAVEARGEVIGDRHGVDVPGQDHPLRPPEHGAGHDRVAVPVHGQVRERPERALDGVGQRPLVAADRGGVHEPGGQRRPVQPKIHPASLG